MSRFPLPTLLSCWAPVPPVSPIIENKDLLFNIRKPKVKDFNWLKEAKSQFCMSYACSPPALLRPRKTTSGNNFLWNGFKRASRSISLQDEEGFMFVLRVVCVPPLNTKYLLWDLRPISGFCLTLTKAGIFLAAWRKIRKSVCVGRWQMVIVN